MTDQSRAPDIEAADRWVALLVLTLFAVEGAAVVAELTWLR